MTGVLESVLVSLVLICDLYYQNAVGDVSGGGNEKNTNKMKMILESYRRRVFTLAISKQSSYTARVELE